MVGAPDFESGNGGSNPPPASIIEGKMTEELENLIAFRPVWEKQCEVCGSTPVVGITGLCGPCTWGESDTINGAWWTDDDEKRYQELLKKSISI